MAISGARDDVDSATADNLPPHLRWTDLQLRLAASDTSPMHAFGRWEDQAHQHLPAARLALSPWKGVLIADEVGLGKTISAIRIIRRLHATGQTGSVIIACPGSLRSKWRQELHHRGDLDAIVADSGRRLLAIAKRLANGEPRVIIVSHGILRRAATLEKLMECLPQTMLTIVDEAHHCRNPRSRLHDAVQFLTMRSQYSVLMTATPVNLREEELWIQLSLLAPDRWPSIEAFYRTMRPTRMLNDVLDGIAQPIPNLPRAVDRFRALEHTVGFAGDPRLVKAIHLIENEEKWRSHTLESSRRKLADLVRDLRPLNDLLVRTRRRDLDWHLAKRNAATIDVDLTVEECRLYDAARRWARTLIQMRNPEGQVFDWALIVPERMASSCLPAFAQHVLRQLRSEARENLDLSETDSEDVDLADVEIRMLRRLGNLSELIDAAAALGDVDSKYDAFRIWLLNSLNEDKDGGVLLFSHFHATLNYLKNRLSDDGVRCEIITGRTPMDDRDRIRENFANGEFDILLSSEVGSEGLDQQHCHRLVNYDLPWNPMRIEQRIGRLDRFGQTADEIVILNLAVEGTIDAAILHRLYHRIRIFEDALGMLDPLLGEAMRMVARAELDRPIGQQIVHEMRPANQIEDHDQDVLSLLDKREMWIEERAVEEREWVGPDPGISSLRESVERLGLHITSDELREWVNHHLGERAQFHPTKDEKIWMMRLDDGLVSELSLRANDPMRIDQDTVGWRNTITKAAEQSGPHWFNVIFDREIAREEGNLIFITPHHPIVRLLCESENPQTQFLIANRPASIPPEAKWCVCIDWTVSSLSKTITRRWLYLTKEGMPLAEESGEALGLLQEGVRTKMTCLTDLLNPIAESLLEAEKRRFLPLLDELRANAEQAWHRRISREMGQLSEADWTARAEGKIPDPRWVRMKNSLITKLQDELAKRLSELDQIRDNLEGNLELRIAIQLE
jgi:superfamily II DNA or RNA helicase